MQILVKTPEGVLLPPMEVESGTSVEELKVRIRHLEGEVPDQILLSYTGGLVVVYLIEGNITFHL